MMPMLLMPLMLTLIMLPFATAGFAAAAITLRWLSHVTTPHVTMSLPPSKANTRTADAERVFATYAYTC